MKELYNYDYYHNCCGPIAYEDPEHWIKFFGDIAERIIKDINPKTVLDAGCAMGYLVTAFRDRGVEAYGIDISEYAVSMAREDIKPYCFVGSLTERLPPNMPRRYDLVVSIEVLEHLYAEDGKVAIKNICNLSDNILFCSSPTDFTELTHFNVQQREYWAKLFAENNFFDDLNYRPTYITPYAMCFRKSENYLRQIEDYERNIRQSEAAHTQTILEWRGAVNDKEVHIQNIEAERRAAEEQWNQKFYNQENLISELNQKAEILETEKKNIETELENKKNDFEILKQEIQKKKFDWTQKEKSLKNKCIEAEEEVYRLQSRLLILEKDLQQSQLEKKNLAVVLEECDKQLNHYHEHYLAAMNQRNDLEQRLRQTQEMYNVISNAACWKITRPVRFLLDAIKCLLKKNHYTHLFCKGLKSLKQNGFSYTWRKVQDRRQHRQNFLTATKPLYSKEELERQKTEKFPREIKFSIVVPLYNTPENFLHEMIQSVIDQTYPNWELCMADGSDEKHTYVKRICQQYTKKDKRILYKKLDKNLGISGNTNACIDMASGDYIGLFDHDDLLMPDALYENMKAIIKTNADVLYSDEDHLSALGKHINPFFKPDWSPDLLYSQMYIGHFLVFRKILFEKIGGFRSEFDGSQDYDLILRISEITQSICHIPKLLYSWRESENSTASNAESKPYAHVAGLKALDSHLKRKYGQNAYAAEGEYSFTYNARFNFEENILVSIIIPMRNKWKMTAQCLESILEKSSYQNFEIILLDNRSDDLETLEWLKRLENKDTRIRVIKADMEFNWSKLNNFGIEQAHGEVFIFLNNDTLVITSDWIERLTENALRNDIGTVGGLLLYPDNTIQHAGVVVGIGGWADHIFKGMKPIHYGSPFVSPMLSRNVLAVTGACMAVSRTTIEKIGYFDESFIICGSDVELGIRAYEKGLFNRYDSQVRLYHLESKSRDTFIPEEDFKKSYEVYSPYREDGDPYFNPNLDISSVVPKEKISMNIADFKNFIKRNSFTAQTYQKLKKALMPEQSYKIAEIEPLNPRKYGPISAKMRLNLLIPSVDQQHVFGGILTAVKFFEELQKCCNCPARVIVLDAPVIKESCVVFKNYTLVNANEDSNELFQLLPMADRYGKTFPVSPNDIFVATGWWTAHVISSVIYWQKDIYNSSSYKPLLYMIQDYEPGFYAWSSRYMMADSTYRLDVPTFAIVNSSILKEFFLSKNYSFTKIWSFEPKLNENIKKFLPENGKSVTKKKQILVYGRPSVARNAFELIIYALKVWVKQQNNIEEWTILSAGEQHDDIDLGENIILHSVGKLSLEDYAKLMLDTYAGISLMVSPHPSYPPLEMSAFGVKVITNSYENKDLSYFSNNIISLKSVSPINISKTLVEICNGYNKMGICDYPKEYLDSTDFSQIATKISDEIIKT